MAETVSLRDVAALKGCSKQTVRRACEQGKLNTDYDPVTNEYFVHRDELLEAWQPGTAGKPRVD